MLRTLRRMIQPEGYDVRDACDAATFSTELEGQPEVILLDLQLGDLSGVELMREVREASPDSEVIMMTGYATIDSVVESMRAGAFDYLEKPFSDAHRVVRTLERALERRNLRVRNRELEGELGLRSALDGIVVQSAAMRRIVQKVVDLSRNESTVLIEAASGTGKELIARAIHETSLRRDGPFVPVDCGALPEGIAEGELFGYIRGAFTGALRDAPGLFRSANGGTLFLDEIGELPIHLQAKLLRAIQEREVKPLGMETAQSIDVRIVAATNRDLTGEVAAGRFRSDLFYRLRVVSIQLPPLCERPEDIPVLAAHFMDRFSEGSRVSGIDPEALESLLGHSWPGNVREHHRGGHGARPRAAAHGCRSGPAELGRPASGESRGDRALAASLRVRLPARSDATGRRERAASCIAARDRPQHVLSQAARPRYEGLRAAPAPRGQDQVAFAGRAHGAMMRAP